MLKCEKKMSKKVDLSGKRFGRLIVINESKKDDKGKIYWSCLCDCGKSTITRGDRLKEGRVSSCGCLQKEVVSRMMKTHDMSKKIRI